MTVSASTAKQLHKVDDPGGMIPLLKMMHASWAAPITIAGNTRNHVLLGDTYVQMQLVADLPNDKAKEAPRVKLRATNVGRDFSAVFEALPPGAALMATLRMVHRSTPTVVDWEFTAPMTGIHTDMGLMTASMGWDDVMRRAAVLLRFDPTTAPGIFPD